MVAGCSARSRTTLRVHWSLADALGHEAASADRFDQHHARKPTCKDAMPLSPQLPNRNRDWNPGSCIDNDLEREFPVFGSRSGTSERSDYQAFILRLKPEQRSCVLHHPRSLLKVPICMQKARETSALAFSHRVTLPSSPRQRILLRVRNPVLASRR